MKTRTILLTLALSVCLVSIVGITVSCEKSSLEDEPMVGASKPKIKPTPDLQGNEYIIKSDGTTITHNSNGYSFSIYAGALTLKGFNCYLSGGKQFFKIGSCNLTLEGNSLIRAINLATISIGDVKLSGKGSITISRKNKDFTPYKSCISAAEGYTVKVSDVTEDDNGFYSCTWKVH